MTPLLGVERNVLLALVQGQRMRSAEEIARVAGVLPEQVEPAIRALRKKGEQVRGPSCGRRYGATLSPDGAERVILRLLQMTDGTDP